MGERRSDHPQKGEAIILKNGVQADWIRDGVSSNKRYGCYTHGL
ncbi:MAG: hypothetical protein OXG37_00650 [Actinomycetia bacterium]|nr:hypothetical protein [Actinomycetes bacterium]